MPWFFASWQAPGSALCDPRNGPNGFPFPESEPRPIAAADVGRDHERPGLRIPRPAHPVPPMSDRVHREARRVAIDSDANSAVPGNPTGPRPRAKAMLRVINCFQVVARWTAGRFSMATVERNNIVG